MSSTAKPTMGQPQPPTGIPRAHKIWAIGLVLLGAILGVGLWDDPNTNIWWAIGLVFLAPPERWSDLTRWQTSDRLRKMYTVTWVMAMGTAATLIPFKLIELI